MPAKTELTWEQATHRWKKIYKGRAYTVSCKTLGVPSTKMDSYRAANEWWATRKAEIDAYQPPHPHAERIDILSRRLAWAVAHGKVELAEGLRGEVAELETDADGKLIPSRPAVPVDLSPLISPVSEKLYESMNVPSPHAELLATTVDDAIWDARIERTGTFVGNKERTIEAQVERFLALERVRVESDQLSVSEFDSIRRCLHAFRDHIGKANLASCLDADQLEGWWSHLVAQPISVEYKKKRLRIAKSFASWLAERGLIPVPLNLRSRRHRFGGGSRSVATIPVSEVRTLVAQASGQLRLHLLLMLNCGMTQIDIAELRPGEVDWERGRIERKRSKTEEHAHVPTVNYPLWASTWQLLQSFGRHEGEHALLTASQRPWLRDELRPDGRRSKVDSIKSNYVHLQRRLAVNFSMKLLRKTSATLIESHEMYGRYTGHFLGHAPGTIAERHYAAPSLDLFDRIVSWLGEQYGSTVTGRDQWSVSNPPPR